MRLSSITSQFQWVLYMLQTPLRSMQLQPLYIWWQQRFHRIPWNYSCHRNWRSPSSMELHGNPLNCSVLSKLAKSKLHGIPWNCSGHRNWRFPSSMEFHGISRVSVIGASKFSWISWNSMDLLLSSKLAHFKFHGIPWIPWNCSGHRNRRTPSSMELHRIPKNCACHRNWRTPSSMEFQGTDRVIEIVEPQVPWNSMKLRVSSKLAHSKFHGIPWICSCQRNWRTPTFMELHGIPWNCSCQKLALSKFHGFHWISPNHIWKTVSSK